MRFLSLQSHVAYGYVGNRAATFPLQRLGHEVWAVNTVEFSNHTGYGAWQGRTASAEQVADIVHGIEALGMPTPMRPSSCWTARCASTSVTAPSP